MNKTIATILPCKLCKRDIMKVETIPLKVRHKRQFCGKPCWYKFNRGKDCCVYIHGFSKHKLSSVWSSIVGRCNNPNDGGYRWYGVRGIKCRWKSFDEFLKDMYPTYKKGLSIDRIDNNGDYCKENCRWVTIREQGRNTRWNRILEYKGESKPMIVWAEIYNIKYSMLNDRINKHKWSVERALLEPPRKFKTKV